MKKTGVMNKLYDSKIFWAVISLVLSLAIWIYVTSLETEEFKQTFRGVRVELVGEDNLRNSSGMVITDLDTSTVTVVVSGPRRVVASLDSSDITAQINVSKLSQAAYTSLQYTVAFPDGTDTGNITVTAKIPETVNFMVSKEVTKTIPVRGSFDNEPAEGYVAEAPVFEPSLITVSGPAVYVDGISYAWVTFGAENISSTYSETTGFVLIGEDGEECSTMGIQLSDDIITATLPILATKEVPLTVNIIPGGGADESNVKRRIEPVYVLLAGDSSKLSEINTIVLDTIDLTEFKTSFTDTIPIKIDNELINLTGVSEASVSVEVFGLETKEFNVSNISCSNVTEGYTAEIITQNLLVSLRGNPETLELVKPENIRVVADLKDFDISTGMFTVKSKVYIDGFSDVGALYISDYMVSVEIRKG